MKTKISRLVLLLALGLLMAHSTVSARRTPTVDTMPAGFVVLSDVVPDIIQEIRYHSTYNFVGTRVDGYEAPVAIMTREAAEHLKAVSDALKAKG